MIFSYFANPETNAKTPTKVTDRNSANRLICVVRVCPFERNEREREMNSHLIRMHFVQSTSDYAMDNGLKQHRAICFYTIRTTSIEDAKSVSSIKVDFLQNSQVDLDIPETIKE